MAGVCMKIDAGSGILMESQEEITVQSDYPSTLIAADSMSQSGVYIINQWLLLSLLLPLFLWAIFQCKTGLWTIPSSETKGTAQSVQVPLLTKHQ